MKQTLLTLMLGYLAIASMSFAEPGKLEESLVLKQTERFIKEVMTEVLNDSEFKQFFPGISANDIKIQSDLSALGADGWIRRCPYEQGLGAVRNTGKGSRRFNIIFENDNSVMFDLFVAYKEGDGRVSRTRAFVLSEEPRIVVGYLLETKSDHPELRTKIEGILQKKLIVFGKDIKMPNP